MFEYQKYKDIFNERAGSYHYAMTQWPRARNAEFESLINFSDIDIHHSILDIPSGGGYLSWYFPKEYALLHLETSKEFAEVGRRITPHPILQIEENRIPLADNSIDRVLSLAGMHHIGNKKNIFSEIARVLLPGGKAIIADAYIGSDVARFLDEGVNRYNPMGHSGTYFEDFTLTELSDCGLTIMRADQLHYHWVYSTENDMINYCKNMFGMTHGNNRDIRNAIYQYLGEPLHENNQVKMPWSLYFIVATKIS